MAFLAADSGFIRARARLYRVQGMAENDACLQMKDLESGEGLTYEDGSPTPARYEMTVSYEGPQTYYVVVTGVAGSNGPLQAKRILAGTLYVSGGYVLYDLNPIKGHEAKGCPGG